MKDLIQWHRKGKSELAARKDSDVFSRLRREMNEIFEKFAADFDGVLMPSKGFGALAGSMSPKFDVAETDEAFEVTAELPGIDEKNIDVSLDENVLTVKGEKKEEHEDKKKLHVSERSYGFFERSFSVPSGIDAAKVKAEFKKGVLKIRLPKTEQAKSKAKKIHIGS